MFNDKNAEKYGKIKGLSDKRRLPILGKIRLGIKVKRANAGAKCQCKKPEDMCMYCTRPKETDYFVCPPEVQAVFGPEPKELDIMFPVPYLHIIFPQSYGWYGSTRGLKCKGNGETAMRFSDDKKDMQEIDCPCENLKGDENPQGKCNKMAFLMAMIPKVSMGGVYQIHTGSYHSILDVNSGLEFAQAVVGRLNLVPLKLRRIPRETHHEGSKQTHYTLSVVFDQSIDLINQLSTSNKRILLEAEKLALPAPKAENPEYDEADILEGTVDEEDEVAKGPQNSAQQGDLSPDVLEQARANKMTPSALIGAIRAIITGSGKKGSYESKLIRKYNPKYSGYDKFSKPDLVKIYMELKFNGVPEL